MYTKLKLLFFGLLTLVIAAQCQTKSTEPDKAIDSNKLTQEKFVVAKFDTINQQLIGGNELMTHDLVELKIIDTSVTTQLAETCYCDTTIQLNDSIAYSVISVNDEAGLCTYFFLASLNLKNKTIAATKFLHPACDVDYSWDSYDLYDHEIISPNKIHVTKTMIFQKKERKSMDEDENIDHKEIQHSYLNISPAGQISLSKK